MATTRELTNSLVVSSEPALEPVTVAEYAAYRKISYSADDTSLTSQIQTGRELASDELARTFITTTYVLRMRDFPCVAIELRMPPVQSVTSIQYIDTAGDTQTWSSDEYVTELKGLIPTIATADGYTWPTVQSREVAVIVTYVAGFGLTSASVPAKYKQAIMWRASVSDEFREPIASGRLTDVPMSYDRLIASQRLL